MGLQLMRGLVFLFVGHSAFTFAYTHAHVPITRLNAKNCGGPVRVGAVGMAQGLPSRPGFRTALGATPALDTTQPDGDEALSVRGGGSKPPLARNLLGDVTVAIAASFAVSPMVSIIDKAIVQYAAGSAASLPVAILASGSLAFTNLLGFLAKPEFLIVWGVYLLTYVAANCIASVCEKLGVNDEMPKFIGVSFVNIAACVSKDAVFARMFGTGPARQVPALTFALFCLRDSLTVLASFTLPSRVATLLQARGFKRETCDTASQLVCPMGVQILSTPVHLLGLSLYNSPGASASSRATEITAKYAQALTARMLRILPAFGIGGILNTNLRKKYRASISAY